MMNEFAWQYGLLVLDEKRSCIQEVIINLRMKLDDEMRKLLVRGPNRPLPSVKMARILAASFDQAASNFAFRIYEDKTFRKLVGFENLEKIEQDRVFNELVVATITLIMLTLDAKDLRTVEEMGKFFSLVRDEIPKLHRETLAGYGIEKQYLDLWDKLIAMRYRQYSEDKLEARYAAMQVEAAHNEDGTLDRNDMAGITLTVPIQTVAIGAHHHICRSKTEGKDELFLCLLRHLQKLYLEIRIPLEGGRISPVMRLRMNIWHAWRRLFPT
ncbi:MAG: hypothetical protein Q8L37_02530 [Candidatus Gottesmanbacteria bacterium]|nr:hypothetical protein [Candidatus Gottesmanbacteria bacterium]